MAKLSWERKSCGEGDVARAYTRGVPKLRLLPSILSFYVFNAIGGAPNAIYTSDGISEGVKCDIVTAYIGIQFACTHMQNDEKDGEGRGGG